MLLIPSSIRWLCPDDVGEIWSVPVSFSDGWRWYDWLDARLHEEVKRFKSVKLAWGLPHPPPAEIDTARYTGQQPFLLEEWIEPQNPITVTMIWRDRRAWDGPDVLGWPSGIRWRILNRFGARPDSLAWQQKAFVAYSEHLRRRVKGVRIAVAGLGRAPAPWPSFIEDRTCSKPDEACERGWVRLYAESHLVMGMHGSNMLLPTAHAGAALILMPNEKWGNLAQDALTPESNARICSVRTVYVPKTINAEVAAEISSAILERLPNLALAYARGFRQTAELQADAWDLRRRTAKIERWANSRFCKL